jgi:hypothetical protein
VNAKPLVLLGSSLVLASGAGFLTSQAVGVGAQAPAKTVTINVATGPAGPAGPAGPQGPPGPAGTTACPTGFSEGELVINHPGGQTLVWTCIGN